MTSAELKHRELTEPRIQAYLRLFGCNPSAIFSSPRFADEGEPFLIDVFVFEIDPDLPVVAAVTNGLSDQRMVNAENPNEWARRLIQYFPVCTEDHARRLHDMAWAPLHDGVFIDSHHSLAWDWPAVEGTPWKNALFLQPIVRTHFEFRFTIEGDEVSLLWHVPITDEEHAFKVLHGSNALIDRMDAVKMPWVFDENNRPSLLE
jgi:hypothetical protein